MATTSTTRTVAASRTIITPPVPTRDLVTPRTATATATAITGIIEIGTHHVITNATRYRPASVNRRAAANPSHAISWGASLIGGLLFPVEQPQPSFKLFLLGHESCAENVIDDRMEAPQLFDRHALKRLPLPESPRPTRSHSLGLQAGAWQFFVG